MELEYSEYSLDVLNSLNRFETSVRKGCYFRLNKKYIIDYCPWSQFGDLEINDILHRIKTSKTLPKQFEKLFSLDEFGLSVKHQSFFNHDLNKQEFSNYIKIKYKENIDFNKFLGFTLRIDFNNGSSRDHLHQFLQNNSHLDIDYIEDPYTEFDRDYHEFEKYNIHFASDRNISSDSYIINIYKPSVDSNPAGTKANIFSSYMGSELDMYHCYLELMKKGDLSLRHGVITRNLFSDQLCLFNQLEKDKFIINTDMISKLYDKVHNRQWKKLI